MHLVRIWKLDLLISLIFFGALVSFSSQTQASQQSSDSKQNQSTQKVTLKFLRLEKVQDTYNKEIVAFFKLANLTSHPFRYETEAAQPVFPVHERLYRSWFGWKNHLLYIDDSGWGEHELQPGESIEVQVRLESQDYNRALRIAIYGRNNNQVIRVVSQTFEYRQHK